MLNDINILLSEIQKDIIESNKKLSNYKKYFSKQDKEQSDPIKDKLKEIISLKEYNDILFNKIKFYCSRSIDISRGYDFLNSLGYREHNNKMPNYHEIGCYLNPTNNEVQTHIKHLDEAINLILLTYQDLRNLYNTHI